MYFSSMGAGCNSLSTHYYIYINIYTHSRTTTRIHTHTHVYTYTQLHTDTVTHFHTIMALIPALNQHHESIPHTCLSHTHTHTHTTILSDFDTRITDTDPHPPHPSPFTHTRTQHHLSHTRARTPSPSHLWQKLSSSTGCTTPSNGVRMRLRGPNDGWPKPATMSHEGIHIMYVTSGCIRVYVYCS